MFDGDGGDTSSSREMSVVDDAEPSPSAATSYQLDATACAAPTRTLTNRSSIASVQSMIRSHIAAQEGLPDTPVGGYQDHNHSDPLDVRHHLIEFEEKMTRYDERLDRLQRTNEDIADGVRDLLSSMEGHSDFHPGKGHKCAEGGRKRKDPANNYLKRCVRQHVFLTFNFSNSKNVPAAPSKALINRLLAQFNQGVELPIPFRYDWQQPSSSPYNRCVSDAFFKSFWECAESGQYNVAWIPEYFRSREEFMNVFRRNLEHLRRCWLEQQGPRQPERDRQKARNVSNNSRKKTIYQNRLDATSHIPEPLGRRVREVVEMVGSAGISSDEERQTLPGQGRQYDTFDKPWRAAALVHLYRHLDLIHATTRNPNGNPIRARFYTARVRPKQRPAKCLPIDCYDSSFLGGCSRVETYVLGTEPDIQLDALWNEVQLQGTFH